VVSVETTVLALMRKFQELPSWDRSYAMALETDIRAILAAPIAAQPAAAEPVDADKLLRRWMADTGRTLLTGRETEDLLQLIRASLAAAPAQAAAMADAVKDWTYHPGVSAQAAAVPEQTVGSALADLVHPASLERARQAVYGHYGADTTEVNVGVLCELIALAHEVATLSRPTAAGEAEPKSAQAAACQWTYESDPTCAWNTGCGNLFAFTEEGPKENEFKFCCYCGGALVESIDRRAE
jgi:hypothetical protein